MRAFLCPAPGAEAGIAELAEPQPGPGEVVIAVAACGLNFADLLMLEGRYQDRPEPPFVPGLEAAGTVLAAGPGPCAFAPGDRVLALPRHGGLAERLAVPAARCLPLPASVPFAAAAALAIGHGTAHLALTDRARLAAGETLLVLGAAGGVGLAAVEVGKLLGARVLAVARGAERQAIARAAGADDVFDSDTPDLGARLRAAGGADVAFDPAGGAATVAALQALRPLGRLLVIGFASGEVPAFQGNRLLVKNHDVLGFWFGGYFAAAPARLAASLGSLLGWLADGRIAPRISATLPLERTAEGLARLRDRAATGKIVVVPGADGLRLTGSG
jgi:NADPH2:quinone reductase